MPPNRGPISGLIRDGKIVRAMVKLGRSRFSRYIGYLNQLSIIRFDESNDISISWIKKKKEKQEELKNSFDRSVFCGFAEWIFIYELIDIREKEIASRIPASKNPIVIFRIGLYRSFERSIFSRRGWVYFGIKQFSRILFVQVEEKGKQRVECRW